MQKYMRTKEVVELLNVSLATLWHWNKVGYLTHLKMGKTTLYLKSEVENLPNKPLPKSLTYRRPKIPKRSMI